MLITFHVLKVLVKACLLVVMVHCVHPSVHNTFGVPSLCNL